jgi:hypothetical protein
MKKITLSLLALSTIIFADSLTLQCSFPEHGDGKIEIAPSSEKGYPYLSFYYKGPGYCYNFNDDGVTIGDSGIYLKGEYCFITINRSTGNVAVTNVDNHGNSEKFKGTCVKEIKQQKANVI